MTWPLCFLGCLVMASIDAISSCSFPDYIQTNGTTPPRDWRGRALDRFTRLQLRITVDGDQLRQWSNESSTLTSTRTCLEVVDGDKYLVSHREKGQRRVSHACLQFVRRSDALFQVRSGASSDRPDLGLCTNTTWQLDGWLVIDRNRIGHSAAEATNPGRERCALRGGFSARISPSSSSSSSSGTGGGGGPGGFHGAECNGGGSEVRLESRCMDGAEDLYIYFRREDCLPEDLHVNGTPPPQRFACLADWRDGQYSFVMLRHERLPQLWLLRLPTRFLAMDDSFNAYIFKDLFASTSSKVADLSVGHVHMGVVRDPPRPVTSLCVDDHEWCASKRDACSTETAFGCARTCHLCNATRPFVCSFPLDWIGVWIDAADGRTVTFNQTAVTVGGVGGGGSDAFHCIEWRGLPPGGGAGGGGTHIKPSSDVMLVATYGNGCRLRYLCLRVLKKSPSVLYVKFSRAVLWPFNVTSVDMIDCRLFTFLPETGGGPSGLLPGKHFRLLYSQQPRQPVQCNLPVALVNLTLQLGDGTRCMRSAHVTESVAGTDVLLTVLGCHSLGPLPKTFECILSFRATPTNDLTIVVRSVVPQASLPSAVSSFASSSFSSSSSFSGRLALSAWGAIYCWVFPDDRPNQFYLYEGSNCNESVRRESHEKRPSSAGSSASVAAAVAAVIFSKTGVIDFDASTIRTTVPASKAVLRRYQPNSSSSSSSLSSGNATNETAKWTNAATENTDFATTNANPLVVLMAIAVFALFYIPCFCTSTS